MSNSVLGYLIARPQERRLACHQATTHAEPSPTMWSDAHIDAPTRVLLARQSAVDASQSAVSPCVDTRIRAPMRAPRERPQVGLPNPCS